MAKEDRSVVVDADEVNPAEIEHRCEEIFEGDQLSERYNYRVYHFVAGSRYFWARTYVEEISTIAVYGPFDGRASMNRLAGPIDDQVVSYLRRRFKNIQTLGPAVR